MSDLPFAVAPPNSPTRQDLGIPSSAESKVMVPAADADEEVQDVDELVCADLDMSIDMRHHNNAKECADMLLKLMMVSSSVANMDEIEGLDEVGKGVCCAYNGLVSRILLKDESKDDATPLRNMITACKQMLDDVLRNPVKDGVVVDVEDNRLTIAMVDLLKTAFHMSGSMGDCREYSRKCRSMESQGTRDLCTIMQSKRSYELEAYATGEQMRDNFDAGLAMLDKLKDKDDECMLAIIESGRKSFCRFMPSFMLATVLDNRRMKAASIISARMYGDPKEDSAKVFGSSGLLGLVFDSCSSIVSITRSVKTICALMTMSYASIQDHFRLQNMTAGMAEDQATVKAFADAAETPYCKEINEFLSKRLKPVIYDTFNANPAKPDAPGTNTAIFNCVADWFEQVVRDGDKSNTLMAVFQYSGFRVNQMHSNMKTAWDEFNELNDIDKSTTSFSLWYIADFLVNARLTLHDHDLCGTNLLMTSMMVLSGAIGTLMEPSLTGPFKFDDHVTGKADRLASSILKNDKRLCLRTATAVRKRPNKDKKGKTCKATKITKKIMWRGKVRAQNDKSVMMDTRLSVCFFMLSLSEEIKKDISQTVAGLPDAKSGARALVSEGRKDGRRIYIIALETLPNANFMHCREAHASHLIEKNRKNPKKFETTGDNTEKPFRDLVGGAVLNTILYPLAGSAFVYSLQDIVDCYGVPGHVDKHGICDDHYYFKSTTNTCVNHFISRLEDRIEKTFDVRSIVAESDGPVRVGIDECKEVFLQQKSFANRVCDVIKDCGTLWEDLQLSFAVQKTADDDDGYSSDDSVAQPSPPGGASSSVANLLSIIEAPDQDDDDDEDFPALNAEPLLALPEPDDDFDDDDDEFEDVTPARCEEDVPSAKRARA